MAERKLVSVQIVSNLEPIEGADKIEKVTVQGWECVAKKGEFNIGDKCFYFEIDSILPSLPCFEFMKERKYRVRTIKLRGQISQGLALPVSTIKEAYKDSKISFKNLNEGEDYTDLLGIKKYDPQATEEEKLDDKIKQIKNPIVKFLMRFKWFRNTFFPKKTSGFPSHLVSKTDEERIQNCKNLLTKYGDSVVCYATEKLDGQSGSYILHKNKFYVCSRNMHLATPNNSNYWTIARQYDIENKLKQMKKDTGYDFAIQGEIIGEGIQKNKYSISGLDFYVFNIINTSAREKLDLKDILKLCSEYKFKIVPILDPYFKLEKFIDVHEAVTFSKGNSVLRQDQMREGVVIRDVDNALFSFKIINPDFLLKFEE